MRELSTPPSVLHGAARSLNSMDLVCGRFNPMLILLEEM
jgi:hypothetical protein